MAHLKAGVDNVVAGATYQHVDPEVGRYCQHDKILTYFMFT